MEISPRKMSKHAQEPVDEWLQNEGYFRKQTPKDPTCLFRAVSEQVYLTQYYHIRVRKECVEFMRKMPHLFVENIVTPYESYLEQMACFTEWGGINEIQAMSLLYKKEFVVFNGHKQTRQTVTNNGFSDVVCLCFTPQKQYESIYTKDFVSSASYCQSIVYQLLYKDVFHMTDIDSTVHKMLHDRSATYRHDKFFLKDNLEIRDQLTVEIYNKVENENNETDEAQSAIRAMPPFPYRVAKALDPNIYRNTDFDIWHEIRREVKNAGWTRFNTHELQIGGRCLVQMDVKEEDFDKFNNNSIHVCSLEKDANGNNARVEQSMGKQKTVYFYGYVQEMSKNRGPVLVFIQELGEKRIVPYNALKPSPLKKNKQNNWSPSYKRNVVVDSNHKLKKPCGTSSRKIKDTVASVTVLSNNIDKNGNNSDNVNEAQKCKFQVPQWKEDPLKAERRQTLQNYAMHKRFNYPVHNSGETNSRTVMLDNDQSSIVEDIRYNTNKECEENTSFASHSSDDITRNKAANSESPIGIENNVDYHSHSKQSLRKQSYYSPYSGEPTAAGNETDDMQHSINSAIPKCIDVNGPDLSQTGEANDPFAVRFFYNLGLEYYRASNTWNYPTNGQNINHGQWYSGAPQAEEEVAYITNAIQDCSLTHQTELSNDKKDIGRNPAPPETTNKCVNGTRDNTQTRKFEMLRGNGGKESSYAYREKIKEQLTGNKEQRLNRSGVAPRFKKSSEGRYRNYNQQYNQHQQGYNPNQNQYSGPNAKSFKPQEPNGDNINLQQSNIIPHQAHVQAAVPNSYHVPYMQQNVYPGVPGLPYYTSEVEGFANPYYAANQGFFSYPCLPHSEIPENNNMQPFPPHMWSGVDYAQAYPGLCPQYMCPQPTSYNIPPQNLQEQWYAVAGQPQYMQYAPILPTSPEAACNGIGQNGNQSTPA